MGDAAGWDGMGDVMGRDGGFNKQPTPSVTPRGLTASQNSSRARFRWMFIVCSPGGTAMERDFGTKAHR